MGTERPRDAGGGAGGVFTCTVRGGAQGGEEVVEGAGVWPEDDGALFGVLLVPEAYGAGLEFVECPGGDGLGEDEVAESARVDAVERPRAAGGRLYVEALIGVGRTPGGIGTARGDVEEVAAECAVGGRGVGEAAQGAQDAEPGAGEDGEGEVADAREEGAV